MLHKFGQNTPWALLLFHDFSRAVGLFPLLTAVETSPVEDIEERDCWGSVVQNKYQRVTLWQGPQKGNHQKAVFIFGFQNHEDGWIPIRLELSGPDWEIYFRPAKLGHEESCLDTVSAHHQSILKIGLV